MDAALGFAQRVLPSLFADVSTGHLLQTRPNAEERRDLSCRGFWGCVGNSNRCEVVNGQSDHAVVLDLFQDRQCRLPIGIRRNGTIGGERITSA
jgi:hypothetical protein